MTYTRVIPRDLFNEANLLKCYGQLYLNLEQTIGPDYDVKISESDNLDQGFEIYQDPSDGSLTIHNLFFYVRGEDFVLSRPLNARGSYPLMVQVDDEEIAVFNDDGSFTKEMMDFLKADQ